MMSKIFSTLSLIGVVALMGYEYMQMVSAQQQIQTFVSAGPRFTAADGQELCERVKALEMYSYGYQAAGKKSPDCTYMKKVPNEIFK